MPGQLQELGRLDVGVKLLRSHSPYIHQLYLIRQSQIDVSRRERGGGRAQTVLCRRLSLVVSEDEIIQADFLPPWIVRRRGRSIPPERYTSTVHALRVSG